MNVLTMITCGLGLGVLYECKYEWLSKDFSNVTLGIHSQEWDGKMDDKPIDINQLFIGLFFIRFVFEFYKV